MHAFTQRLAQRIEQPQEETIADSLVDAGEIMRMWRFFGGDPAGSAVVGPFSEQTEFPWVQADDIERLKQAPVQTSRPPAPHPTDSYFLVSSRDCNDILRRDIGYETLDSTFRWMHPKV